MITHEWIADPSFNAVKFFLENGNLQKIVLDSEKGQERYIISRSDEKIIATGFDDHSELMFTSNEEFYQWIHSFKRCHVIVQLF